MVTLAGAHMNDDHWPEFWLETSFDSTTCLIYQFRTESQFKALINYVTCEYKLAQYMA